jgi:hypothetical protein
VSVDALAEQWVELMVVSMADWSDILMDLP